MIHIVFVIAIITENWFKPPIQDIDRTKAVTQHKMEKPF